MKPLITNAATAPIEAGGEGPWSGSYRVLTAGMREAGGKLGMAKNVVPPGGVGCPFHWHMREDELFFVLSGRGILRYGDEVREVSEGDCISCPAGKQVAHQLANPFEEDLVYLSIGDYDPHEVCGYPDTGKVMIRHMQTVGELTKRDYMHGEPSPPLILSMKPRSE